jgi:hypothetical protein
MSYSNPIYKTTIVRAADLSSAAVVDTFIGPAGKTGRVVDVTYLVTTGVTVAPSNIRVGPNSDPDAGAIVPVPVSSAGASGQGVRDGASPNIDLGELSADTEVEISTSGAADAGAADIYVVTVWY